MSTKLDKTIRREIEIDGEPFTIAISPDGFRLTRKRFRSGVAMSWKVLWTRQHGPVSPSAGPAEQANEGADDRTNRQEPGKTA
jgi:hypothetical protein